jgi:hypothetical protein
MSFTENWGTEGTEGRWDWLYNNETSVAIGTYDGTTTLDLAGSTVGSAVFPRVCELTSGSFHARQYTDYFVTGKINRTSFLVAENAGGSALWFTSSLAITAYAVFYEWYNGTSSVVNTANTTGHDAAYWGTISVTEDHGTLYGTTTVNGTAVATVAAPGWTFPSTLTPAFVDYSQTGDESHIDFVEYPYFSKTILDFVGTWNDGSSSGTINFGDDVLSIGNVSEYANTPLQTRGFSANVPVTIDDSADAWTDFVGDMTAPSWLNGTWYVRYQWGTTWTTLLTGQVNAEDINYNAGEKIVNFPLNSMLRRRAENVLGYDAHYTDGTAAGGQVIDSMTVLMELGTITGTGTDGRTISFQRDTTLYTHPLGGIFTARFHDNEYLWEGTEADGDSVSIGSTYHKVGNENGYGSLFDEGASVYSGTFTVSRVPEWMTTGAVMYYTRRWPSETQITGAGGYTSYGSNPAGYVKGVLYHMDMGTGSGWAVFGSNLDLWYNVSPTHYYYGGEKYVDILHDIAQTALFSYSTDADGEFYGFVMAPVDGTSTQALDFQDAYNNEWAVGYTQPVSKVVVKSGWIESENKFGASVEVEGSDYPSSKTETIEAYWIESGVVAKSHGVKIQRMYGDPADQITLEFEGSEWKNIASGITVAIDNIPSAYPVKGTSIAAIKVPDYYTVSGKTHLREDDITQINLTRQIGGNWFTLNVSLLNGTDILW